MGCKGQARKPDRACPAGRLKAKAHASVVSKQPSACGTAQLAGWLAALSAPQLGGAGRWRWSVQACRPPKCMGWKLPRWLARTPSLHHVFAAVVAALPILLPLCTATGLSRGVETLSNLAVVHASAVSNSRNQQYEGQVPPNLASMRKRQNRSPPRPRAARSSSSSSSGTCGTSPSSSSAQRGKEGCRRGASRSGESRGEKASALQV